MITEGDWWPADYAGPPLMSFAAEEGRELGLKLGDTLTVNVLGRDLTATIASFREVRFETMGINFLIIARPGGAGRRAAHPHRHRLRRRRRPRRRCCAPSPTPTRTSPPSGCATPSTGSPTALDGIGAATRWAAAATLLTGFMVLIGAAAAGERRRVFEAAVLKTLGAGRARILASFALRAALIGAAAGLVAIAAGGIAGWWVTTFVMEGELPLRARSPALAIVAGGALASLLAGLAFALRPLAARPARGAARARMRAGACARRRDRDG